MLKWFKVDLHVHTVLSPCGDLLMGPKNIVDRALKVGLNALAITDHNASENVLSVMKAARGTDLLIIPGMELSTQEEAHVICLFSEITQLMDFQKLVYEHLPAGNNDPDFFGPQYIVNEDNKIIGENNRLLIFAASLKAKTIIAEVTKRGGICYPAHIDRKANSLLNQLGFVPPDLSFPVMEISWNASALKLFKKFPEVADYPLMRSSDAHHIEQIGRGFTWFHLETLTFEEIMMAIYNRNGRSISIEKK